MKQTSPIETLPAEYPSSKAWRDRFLRSLLIGAAIFGLIALIPALFSTPNQTLILGYIASYLILLAVIFVPLPYPLRASIFLFLILAIGVSGMLENGIHSNADVYLLTFVATSTLLLSPRAGTFALLISIATLTIGAIVILGGHYQILDPKTNPGNLEDWISGIATQLLLSVIVLAGLRRLRTGFLESRQNLTRVLTSLEQERATLEQRVAERTKELEKKADQLNAAAYIAQQAAEFKNLDVLLPNVVQLISQEFGFYHAGIFLVTEKGDYAILQAASSEGGKRMVERGHRLRVGAEGIVGFVAAERRPRIALDVGTDAVYFDNPDLPDTRSEIAIPLVAQHKLIGVLDVQSTEPQAFHQSDLDILQTLADQIAVAIENVRLITESQALIHELESISKESAWTSWQEQLRRKSLAYRYSPTGIQPLQAETAPKQEGHTLVVPIQFRGTTIGKITLRRKPAQPAWSNDERQLANEIAVQAALALDNARLIQKTRESAWREQVVSSISNQIRETLDLETVLRTSARELQRAFDLQEAEVQLQPSQDDSPENESILSGG